MSTEPNRSLPLFAYGTLMFPEVMLAVIGRVPVGSLAEIEGFAARRVTDQVFPGLLQISTGRARGVLYPDLTTEDWARLDAFEDDFYRLQEVLVSSGGESRTALAYVVPAEHSAVLAEELWDAETFRRDCLDRYAWAAARQL